MSHLWERPPGRDGRPLEDRDQAVAPTGPAAVSYAGAHWRIWIIGAFAIASTPAFADTLAAERIAALLVPVTRFSAEFVQTVRGNRREVRESAEGYLRIERPRRFKWVVEEPYLQVIVTEGEKLFIYDPDLEQVQVRSFASALDGTPALVLAGDAAQIDAQFDVTERIEGESRIFTLEPRSAEALYTEMSMTFAADKLVGIDIFDSLGQVTEVRFYNAQGDPRFPANEFEFTIPPNADVIGNVEPEPT